MSNVLLRRTAFPKLLPIASALALAAIAIGQSNQGDLKKGFEEPPAVSRPLVWWHWMNGNITKQGIQLDLEWMHRIGLAGFQNFDAALATPQVVEQRLVYMTPPWIDAFRYAVSLGEKLGMEEAIAGSPGWSETGGPWVPASQGMKKYVWSETVVEGGRPFSGKLAHPPGNTGEFQDLGVHDMIAAPAGAAPPPQFYADAAVIAFQRPSSSLPLEQLQPKITASGGSPDMAVLTDGDLAQSTGLPIPKENESAWIQYEFAEPQTISAVTVASEEVGAIESALSGISSPQKSIEASNDGQNFHSVVTLAEGGAAQHTVSFPPVHAKYFRVLFKRLPPPPQPAWMAGIDFSSLGMKASAPTEYKISELVLHTEGRVNRFEEKAAFVPVPDLYGFDTPDFPKADAVASANVLDLTSKMHPDGTLDWTPPPGQWIILRFGYSLLGITNHPATKEATGLEVDKLNHVFVKNYMDHYLDSYKKAVGTEAIGHHGIRYVITDSWEAGSQNWTDDMPAQFKKRRGYEMAPWMPVLTGHIVESAAASDRFLWDFRKTIADLIADEHYGQVQASLEANHLGHYGESHESGRAFVGDGMEVKKLDNIPMSAMWTQVPGVYGEQYGYNADDRESASVAHIYGQNLAAAESLTAAAAPWAWSPATLKPTADQELLNGINRFVIHESAHQPLTAANKSPGLTLGPFGQWFNRNETWAEQAGAWVNYLARSSYMLQQGLFHADLLYFYGEDSNLTALFANKAPDIPAGYAFDYINADALMHELSVSSGNITTKSGMRYRLLALDPYSSHMSLPVLRALAELAQKGAVIAGPKPQNDPSLADSQQEFTRLANQLFGDGTGVHAVGQGKVYAGGVLSDVFGALNLPPDLDYSKPTPDIHLEFVHRKIPSGDIYFVDNRSDKEISLEATFRVAGRAPELWRAETGDTQAASYHIAGGRTTVPLHLEPWGTVFVVFREPTSKTSFQLPNQTRTTLATIDGPWTVRFTADRGAPPSIQMDHLASWTDSEDSGVRYFSGAGTYTKTIDVAADWLKPGAHLWLDLGDVKNLAEVTINGRVTGTVWHTPYVVDVTHALKPGQNELAIKVVNAWVNRLVGDQQPNAVQYTYADITPYKANSPTLPSGLLGPVRLCESNR